MRSLFDEYPGVAFGAIFLPALAGPVFVLRALRDEPGWFAILVAASTCIPTALAIFFPMHWIDQARRGVRRAVDETGITGPGLLFAQAAVFLYAPMVASSSEDGPPLRDASLVDWLACIAAAGATAWAGYALKKRQERKLALAKLAATRPHTATRFLVRVDQRGWPEIQPSNVLHYQAAFDAVIARIESSALRSLRDLSARDEGALVRASLELRYSGGHGDTLWPFVTLALALIYVDSPATVRERDRGDWAAAVATNPEASRVRDWVRPIATRLFETHDQSPARSA